MANVLTTTSAPGAAYRVLTENAGPIDVNVVSGNLGAPFVPENLHDEWWVDGATPVPPAQQTGNIERPFSTITQALAAAGAINDGGPYVINVTPGLYVLEGAIPCPLDHGDLNILNTSGPDSADRIVIQTINPTGALLSWLHMAGIATTQPFDATFAFGFLPVGCDFNDCIFSQNSTAQRCSFGVLSAQTATNNLRLVECTLPASGVTFANNATITVEQTQVPALFAFTFSAGGLLRVDNMTWGGMQRVGGTANAPVQLISNEAQIFSDSDLALPADPLQSFPAYTFGNYPGLNVSSIYLIEYYVQVTIYRDANHAVVGQVDFTIQASVSTDAGGVATTTFNTVPIPNISYLPAGLAGASSYIVASANGWTVQAQRVPGVDCHARYVVEWNKVENVT
jgi:hypothetical protein